MREDHSYKLFEKQFGDLPTGGFINPETIEEDNENIVFACHYDNFMIISDKLEGEPDEVRGRG